MVSGGLFSISSLLPTTPLVNIWYSIKKLYDITGEDTTVWHTASWWQEGGRGTLQITELNEFADLTPQKYCSCCFKTSLNRPDLQMVIFLPQLTISATTLIYIPQSIYRLTETKFRAINENVQTWINHLFRTPKCQPWNCHRCVCGEKTHFKKERKACSTIDCCVKKAENTHDISLMQCLQNQILILMLF